MGLDKEKVCIEQTQDIQIHEKIFIATIEYHNLRNHSIGPSLLPQLPKMKWAESVELDELNWGPIAIVQKFQSLPTSYDRV